MNNHEVWFQGHTVSRRLPALMLMLAVLLSVQASAMTVGDLLHEEALAMIKAQRAVSSGVVTPAFELIGIWGIEAALSAQLKYRGQLVEFQQGRRMALRPFDQTFQLLAIQPPCVVFRFKGSRHRACVNGERS